MNKGRVAPSVPYRPLLLKELRDPVFASDYLNEAAEDEHPDVFLLALRDLVDAYGGIAGVARRAGLNRPHLYRTLSNGGNPEFRTLNAILKAAGFSLAVVPRARSRRKSAASVARRNRVRIRRVAPIQRSGSARAT